MFALDIQQLIFRAKPRACNVGKKMYEIKRAQTAHEPANAVCVRVY